MKDDARVLIEEWRNRAARRSFAHHTTAERYKYFHILLGVPVMVFTVTVGSSVFTDLEKFGESFTLRVGFLSLSLLVTVLVGLQTFLNFQDRAERHRKVGASWEAHRMQLEAAQYDGANLEDLQKVATNLLRDSPHVPKQIWNATCKRYPTNKNKPIR